MQYTNSEIADIIAERIHSERDRRIMRMKLIDGMTYERIAEEVEMSPRQVYRLVKKCKRIIEPEQEIFTDSVSLPKILNNSLRLSLVGAFSFAILPDIIDSLTD